MGINGIPYFPFYPSDWLSDEKIQAMSMAGEGVYVHLLAIEWREGSIPADRSAIVMLCKGLDSSAIDEALACFKPCQRKKGRLVNKRLEEERKKLDNFRKSKKTAGLKGAERRWHSHSTPNEVPLAKNASSSSSSPSYTEEKNTPFIPLADFLRDRLKVNVPFQKIPENYQASWSNDFRLMAEADKIPVERIREVLDWSTTDEFWKVNIRSASKFRKQFGALEAKSRFKSREEIRREEVDRECHVGAGLSKSPEEKKREADTQARIKSLAARIWEGKYNPLIEAAKSTAEADRLRVAGEDEFRRETGKIMRGEA